jgi:hypothetical protein
VHTLWPWLLTAALVAACEQSGSPVGPLVNGPSLGSTVERFGETHPIATTITNPCNGEDIALVGVARNTIILVSGPDNLNHVTVDGIIKGTGTGLTSGATYQFHDEFHDSFQTPNLISPDFTTFTHDQSNTVSMDNEPNVSFTFEVHVVGNASGVKTTVENFSGECRG